MTTRPGYVWDATASEWVEIGQAAVLAPIAYQTSAPSSPATGDIWIDSDDEVPSVDSTLYYRWTKTMSGGETSLSGTDNNSLALEYTPGYESVFINGVLQVRGSDYVATTGTTVTGLTALTASDVVMVESIIAYSVGDTYTQSTLNTMFSPITTTGLVLLASQTIGTAVSSVVVNNAFSAAYDNYYITVTGGVGSTTGYLGMQLGATSTGYYRVNIIAPYTTGTLSTFQSTNASSWFAVFPFTTNSISGFADLQNPFTAKNTHFFSRGSQSDTAGEIGINSGYLANTTSYTGFTLNTSTGTITGGTIKVYGYK
jgi:hypothetical protein